MSRGTCFSNGELGNKDLSFLIGDPSACASSSERRLFFFARANLDCSARMNASRKCVYDVVRTGTGAKMILMRVDWRQ